MITRRFVIDFENMNNYAEDCYKKIVPLSEDLKVNV